MNLDFETQNKRTLSGCKASLRVLKSRSARSSLFHMLSEIKVPAETCVDLRPSSKKDASKSTDFGCWHRIMSFCNIWRSLRPFSNSAIHLSISSIRLTGSAGIWPFVCPRTTKDQQRRAEARNMFSLLILLNHHPVWCLRSSIISSKEGERSEGRGLS